MGHDGAPPESIRNLAARLPLVHRTGHARSKFGTILTAGELVPQISDDETQSEVETLAGIPENVFCNLGRAAYPKGQIAFLLEPSVLADNATMTPFDTGAVARGRAIAATWTNEQRADFIKAHLGSASDLGEFAACYIDAHFDTGTEYVVRGREEGPDQAPYHCFSGDDLDCRAWTVECQSRERVELSQTTVRRIVVANKARRREVQEHRVELLRLVYTLPHGDESIEKAVVELALGDLERE